MMTAEEENTGVELTGPDGEVEFKGTVKEFEAAAARARVTYPSNGSLPSTSTVLVEDNKVSIGEAMRRAVEELGDRLSRRNGRGRFYARRREVLLRRTGTTAKTATGDR